MNLPKIYENYSLKNYNTFSVESSTKYFTEVNSIEKLKKVIHWSKLNKISALILGEGSNILFTAGFDGLVIKNNIKGIKKIGENTEYIWLQVNSGEIWNDLVQYSVEQGYSGIENLACIPGTVGASPVQNIGAYGVEVRDVLESVQVYDINDQQKKNFHNSKCEFGYRSSIFKRKKEYFVTSIKIRLNKKAVLNLKYKGIKEEIEKQNIKNITLEKFADIINTIRSNKLPDYKTIPNAGSFFKNPYVSHKQFVALQKEYTNIPSYPVDNKQIKIPAGWLIDKSGYRGIIKGNVGTYQNQALVLINHGAATGKEILDFSREIQKVVFKKFGIEIQPEVVII